MDIMNREAVFEQAQMRQKKFEQKLIEIPWHEKLMWGVFKVLDAVKRAQKMIAAQETKEEKTKKILNRILNIAEAVLFIVAGKYAKRFF